MAKVEKEESNWCTENFFPIRFIIKTKVHDTFIVLSTDKRLKSLNKECNPMAVVVYMIKSLFRLENHSYSIIRKYSAIWGTFKSNSSHLYLCYIFFTQ